VPSSPVETFLQEAEELLAQIEQAALQLDSEGRDEETVNQLFRAFHTIKGSGAMCGLTAVAGFTHHVEGLLDRVRSRRVELSSDLTGLVLRSADHIKALLAAECGGEAAPQGAGEALVQAIERLSGAAPDGPAAAASAHSGPRAGGEERTFAVRFRPDPGLLANGGKPIALLNELRRLGRCEVIAHDEDVPGLDALEPDRCYLHWSATLTTAADENAIRDVFLFVEDGASLEIEAATPEAREPACAAVATTPLPPSGEPPAPSTARQRSVAREATVRVPADRLDRLVNLVGEFVMNQSRLAQASQNAPPEVANPVQVLERLVAELRDSVLGIRMLPIGTLFGRFRRLVHDLSAELGKEVDLVTEGAETELDKSILDQLGEPLVHCLRNCLDHGVETPAERVRMGKPRCGAVRLSAVHTGADVVVSVSDDGRGVDRAAVRAKAVERGLVAPDAVLSDQDIIDLILRPGFSTASQVTAVSGRGVGMDVVKRQIESLRGSVSISSQEGKGTRLSIALPLTLAIIDGLLVQVGPDRFILPMPAVQENVELRGAEKARHNGRNVIAVRGDLIPYIDLRRTFRMGGAPPPVEKVVIVQHQADRVGLVVDRVLGAHQTVIQTLGKCFRDVNVVSGATIMGDGQVALIVDIAAVVRFADRLCQAGQSARAEHPRAIAC
jgi:two-component system chemotaxis sensor kinase CheA